MPLLHQIIAHNAETHPHKAAIILDGYPTSYKSLQRSVNEIAVLLNKVGVLQGERVGLYAPMSISLLATYLAILQQGAISAAIHHTLSRSKLVQLLRQSGAKVLVTECTEDLPDLIVQAGLEQVIVIVPMSDCPPQVVELATALASLQVDVRPAQSPLKADPERPTSIFYTSGSTFMPKGVLVNHRIMLAACASVTGYLENTPDDRILSYSTLASDYGVYNILMPLYFGGTSVIERCAPTCAKDVLQVVARQRITGMHVFPPVFFLLAAIGFEWQARIPTLRYISSSGQALYAQHIHRIRQTLPQVRLFSSYGLTECKRVSYLAPEDIDRFPTSVGKPLPGVRVYLVDENDRLIDQPGQVGELLVTSEYLMLGYWDMPQANAQALVNDMFGEARLYRTGDLFRVDKLGQLYYVARKDDVFARDIWNVNPREIEQCLAAHPAVAEVRVVAVANESAGHVPRACIVLKAGHTDTSEQVLLEYCRTHLDWHMVPTECMFMQALPRTESGKFTSKGLI